MTGYALKRGRCLFGLLLDHEEEEKRYLVKIGKMDHKIAENQNYRVEIFLASSVENGHLHEFICTKQPKM